jgi:hypothetical protein
MKKSFLLLKNTPDTNITGEFVIKYRNGFYPLSKKSDIHAIAKYSDNTMLSEDQINLAIKLRRAKVGDMCHITHVPLHELPNLLPLTNQLGGEIMAINNDKLTVRITNMGLSAHTITLKRNNIVLTNCTDTHKIAYFKCSECGIAV